MFTWDGELILRPYPNMVRHATATTTKAFDPRGGGTRAGSDGLIFATRVYNYQGTKYSIVKGIVLCDEDFDRKLVKL